LSGSPDASDAAASEPSPFCVGDHTSQRSGVYLAVQFIGSMQAWLRNGVE
jgi:hypothetical protein